MSMTGAITRIALAHLQVPFKEPFRLSAGEVAVKDAICVTLETSDGVAVGEGAPAPLGLADPRGTPGACWDALCDRIAPALLGQTFRSVDDIAACASAWVCGRAAAAAAETACWDLLAQSRRETVAELLGAAHSFVNMRVESGLAVGLYPTVVELLKVIETHLAEGYRRVKIAIAPGRDVELVRAVRQHFGVELPLMVDGNGAYTRDDIAIFQALDEFDLLMFEQPMRADDLDGLAALQAAVTTPVCLDETADGLPRTAEALRRGAARVVNIKIQRVGGLGPALAMHDLCQAQGAACWVGTTPELGIGQAQGVHLATLHNCKYPTDVEPSTRWFVDDYVVPRLELTAPGLLSVPTRPGLGYQVDPVKLRRYQVRQREFTARTSG
jgi:O-succinylbenzoate synthase